MNRFSKNTVFCEALVAEQCDMCFLEIDLKTKNLHIIECRGQLLFLQSIYSCVGVGISSVGVSFFKFIQV